MSSPRTRGPIRRGLSTGRAGKLPWQQSAAVVMGRRVRGDDAWTARSSAMNCFGFKCQTATSYSNSLPPCGAGLSHVQEHIDEEAVVPGSAFELASQGGLCVGMIAGNIEGK